MSFNSYDENMQKEIELWDEDLRYVLSFHEDLIRK